MSLDAFFAHPGPNKKKKHERKKGAKANANKAIDSSNDELGPEDEAVHGPASANNEELCEQRDKLIVNCVTANIEKMLDSKLANIIKPVSEFSGKLDSLIQMMGTAEQRISDLEDTSAATAPRVKALEGELQKALDRLENFENQSRRQSLRIVGLNEGSEGRTPVEFFEKWIPDVLGMQTDRIKLDRAHRTGPPTRLSGKEGPRAVLVRLHDYTNKQKILQAARNRGTLSIDGSNVSFYQDFSRGVVILLHKNLPFTVTASFKDTEGRFVLVKGILHGEVIVLGNVYGPNIQDEAFYASLLRHLADMDCPNIIIGGDFNCALSPMMDRLPLHANASKNAQAVLNINREFDLVDIWRHYNPLSKQYTFHSQPHLSASRIDYIFVSRCLLGLVEHADIGLIALSDHAPVVMAMHPPRPSERSFSWRMNATLLMDEKFIKYLTDQTDLFLEINDKNGADPRIVWDTYKAYMRGMIISYTSRRKKERAAKQLEIENKVKLLEETYYKTRSEATLIELKSTRTALNNLITRKAERDILFTKQNFFELANKPNRLLARLARNAPIKSYISAVQDENQQRQTNNRQINESFKRFYTKLYSSEIDKERLGAGSLLDHLCFPQISKDQFDRLESPISILEIDKAISTLQSGKCPGEDGFPVEFFKVMKGKINKLLLRVFDKSLEESVLPESMYGANITLIVKKNRNPELCSSYRPISLLNVDNKIFSKILALRLENVVNTIVDADQTGFICGRNSYHNTRRLLHIIHHLNTNKTLGAVVSMDAEKYMFEVMKRFGFGCGFLRWVRLLYKAPTASVLTNGLLSAPFKVKRGTAQGSPLSPTLFALAIEPLALAIRQNPDIQGVTIGTKQHKMLLYADDILLTLTKPCQSLIALTTCLREFSLISGYKVNFDKSEIMILDNDIKIEPPYIQPFRWAPSGFDYLGIRIVPQLNRLYSENITPLVKKVQEMLTRWKNLPVSFLGRINLIKMTVLPKILYPTSMLFVNLRANDIANMNKALSDFIWNGRKPKVKLAGLQLPREQGGWGLPNIEYYVLSLQARIVSAWVNGGSDSPWLDIESFICTPLSPVNLLGKSLKEIPHTAKDNPLITHVLWAWKKCVKIFNNTHPLSLLMTLVDNTELSPQGTGSNSTPWRKVGIVRILDLFENGKFKTFESLKDKYHITNKDFYKYLQIRHFVYTKNNSLEIPNDSHLLDRFFIRCKQQKHFISKFYSEILSLNLSKLPCLRTSWCTLLKCVIDDDVWDEILRLPSRISICNRYKELQYKILHHIYISPQIYSKYRTGTSPNCPKCKSCIGTRFHCLWECKKVQTFWRAVCLSVSKATGQQVSVDPLMCLLGKIPASLKNNEM
uniref:Reverse transcriptase domain-containing protein n=1 Tax=Gouania willdenowi TaxID=441366 RepID=A0A8C5N7I9_GOUWI